MYCFVRIEWLTWLGYSRDDGLIYPDTCAFLLLCVRYWHPRLALFFWGGWRQLTREDVLWPCWIRGYGLWMMKGRIHKEQYLFLRVMTWIFQVVSLQLYTNVTNMLCPVKYKRFIDTVRVKQSPKHVVFSDTGILPCEPVYIQIWLWI